MNKRNIISNDASWSSLRQIRVQSDIPFDPAKLGRVLRWRLKEAFPNSYQGVAIRGAPADVRNCLMVTYPDQMIAGKQLTEEALLRVLTEIENETAEALRQHALLDLVES